MKATVLHLLAAATWRGGSSLRLHESQSVRPVPGSHAVTIPLRANSQSHLPNWSVYEKVWRRRHSEDKSVNEAMSGSIQLVLGVFTIASEAAYRATVRQTWLNQTGVCYLQPSPREGCSVHVGFVMGKNGTGTMWDGRPISSDPRVRRSLASAHEEPGVLLLDIEENMNLGKTPLWFLTALQMFPWATHIGKMDMDTFPLLHKLVHRMAEDRSCVSQVSPYEFIGRSSTGKPGNFTAACYPGSCDRYHPPLNKVWHHMEGQFYALSMPLVQKVNWSLSFYNSRGEDCETTRVVAQAAHDNGFCVFPRNLDSWYHGP